MINRRRIRLAITNRGVDPVNEASILLQLPFRPRKVRLVPAVHGRQLPSFRMIEGQESMRLDFPEVPGQTSYVFLVALDEE
jgi:hypothetical protein